MIARFFACFTLCTLLLSPAIAGEEKKVKVTVVVILASEEGDKIDARLKDIAAEIQKENPKLKSFTLKRMDAKSLAANEKSSFDLVDSKTAHVIVKHGADKENKVSLTVTPPNRGISPIKPCAANSCPSSRATTPRPKNASSSPFASNPATAAINGITAEAENTEKKTQLYAKFYRSACQIHRQG